MQERTPLPRVNTSPLQALGTYITVEIDLEKRKEKPLVGKFKTIIVPDAYQYMIYNLQYGPILSVGKQVENPEIKVGRIAIFHHMVESQNNYLLYRDDAGKKEIRHVDTESMGMNYKLFGVIDENGVIIPTGQFTFCEPQSFESGIEEVKIPFEGMTDYLAKASLTKSGIYVVQKEVTELDVDILYCKVLYPPHGQDELSAGDIIVADAAARYPLDLFDATYWIFNNYFIYSKFTRL